MGQYGDDYHAKSAENKVWWGGGGGGGKSPKKRSCSECPETY